MSEKRFEKVYAQGAIDVMEIWVDKETGVNYLYHYSGYSGGLTPLLDREAGIVPCVFNGLAGVNLVLLEKKI